MSPSETVVLPPGTRLIHIGPQKTGSTAVQAAFAARRNELRTHGVVYPGSGFRPRAAVRAVLGYEMAPGAPVPPMSAWDDLVSEVRRAGDLRVCISNEDFAKANARVVEKIVRDLGGERAHVLAVARRLDRLLPSQWQQRIRSGFTLSYEEWLADVLVPQPNGKHWNNLWRPHDIERLVGRWRQRLGADRFTLVVADENDRTLLPQVFEDMLGLPRGLLDSPDLLTNPSLTMNEVELVRAVNKEFADRGWTGSRYATYVQEALVGALRSGTSAPADVPIGELPRWAAERVAELSDQRASVVKSLGVHVIGNPDNLRMPGHAASGTDAVSGPLPVAPETGARAVAGVLHRALEELGRAPDEPGRRRVEEASWRELVQAMAVRGRRVLRRNPR